jgi:hypothetical protein
MEKKPTIYCSLEMLVYVSEMLSLAFKDEKAEDIFLWNNWYNLIANKSQLFVDADMNKIEEFANTNSLIKALIKNSSRESQKSKITPMPDFFAEANFNNAYPANSIFLLDKSSEECWRLENECGTMFINKEGLVKKGRLLFSWALYNVTKDTKAIQSFKNWKELQNFKHPFNAMIIVDNYILDEQKSLDNLKLLLENYLPTELKNTDFHLMIITSHQKTIIKKVGGKTETMEIDKYKLQDKYDKELKNLVQRLDKPYQIITSLIGVSSDKNHDRNIFTNYFWLHSGHGFDYFSAKGEVTNQTNLMIFPIFYQNEKIGSNQNSVYEAVYQHLSEVKRIVDRANIEDITIPNTTHKLPNTKNACGNKENRLLL